MIMNRKPEELTDRFGVVASALCAAHCAICGVMPAVFAAFGLGFLLSHEVEWFLVLVAVLVGCVALNLAWQTHRSYKVAGLLVLGIVGLLASRGLEMGASHDEHHGGAHHGSEHVVALHHDALSHGELSEGVQHAEGEDAHSEHSGGDVLHVVGAGLGGGSGLLLFWGHLINIRTARRFREDCCRENRDWNHLADSAEKA